MKAVITNRIYLDNTPELEKHLLDQLVYKIPKYRPELPPDIITNVRIVNESLISIPSGRVDLIPEEYEIIDKRLEIPVELPEFSFTLRDSQQEVYDQVNSSCFINAQPSWGKTFTGLAIAKKLAQKTLILVHTDFLLNQWRKEVIKVLGFEPGLYNAKFKDTTAPITIGMIQSVTRAHVNDFNRSFGTVLVDECHHCPASSFQTVLDKSHAKYKIGLSASDKRKDGKHVIFPDYFGKKVFKPAKENYMTPEVHIIELPIAFPDGADPWHAKISWLIGQPEYIEQIAIICSHYANKGHKVLSLYDRTKAAQDVHKVTSPHSVVITGEIKSNEERDYLINKVLSGEADIIHGAKKIFAEGVSVNPLSCLVLPMPFSNIPQLEQFIGRVTRIHPGKPTPIIVDVRFRGKTVTKQQRLRDGYYLQEGYKIKYL